MSLRDQRQEEFAELWIKHGFGILNLCPRFGKIKTSINIFKKLNNNPRVLIIHPIETIKKSWEDDLELWGYNKENISYVTTASLWKLAEKPELYDLIVVDEIHLLSPANLTELKAMIDFGNRSILGLSGTISTSTQYELLEILKLPIVGYYSIEQGIKEKVITNYRITVIKTELDSTNKYIQPSKTKKFFITEKQRYDYITTKINECKEKGEDLGLLPIMRMQVLKRSISKLKAVKKLLRIFKDDRVLVFCGLTEIADNLGIPVYHSKNKDNDIKEKFCKGEGKSLATVDMFEAGVTIRPISKCILGDFDSNPENLAQRISRLTGFEYDNPDKVAEIYIVCTNTVEEKWLIKALEFFDLDRVSYAKIDDI